MQEETAVIEASEEAAIIEEEAFTEALVETAVIEKVESEPVTAQETAAIETNEEAFEVIDEKPPEGRYVMGTTSSGKPIF